MTRIKRTEKGTITPAAPFPSLEEEAAYWDTHSVVDDIDRNTPVGFHRARKEDTLTIRFDAQDLQKLKDEALQKGIGPSTLARMWIKEHLGQ